jgi:mono/diheme cytochrome c family protein
MLVGSFFLLLVAISLRAQAPAGPPAPAGQGAAGGGRGGGQVAYPARVTDPVAAERGAALYGSDCAFCHGRDTRGGDGGPSLLRSQLVQRDQKGELIGPVLLEGRPGMPSFSFTPAQIADIAEFLHSITLSSRDPARMKAPTIVTGDAAAGEKYFAASCSSCHSATGDLKGFAAKFPEPRALQQAWLMPGVAGRVGGPGVATSATPISAIVTFNGQKFEGRLLRMDEFIISISQPDGSSRTFRREVDGPPIELRDPLGQHKALLKVYADKDIHDVTAYLVTLK